MHPTWVKPRPGAWLVEGSLIKPFIDVTGEAIDLRTAAFGRFLFGKFGGVSSLPMAVTTPGPRFALTATRWLPTRGPAGGSGLL